MFADSRKTAEVLLPLALAGAYTYAVPHGLTVAPGDYVEVPLGPRSYIGCVWRLGRSFQVRAGGSSVGSAKVAWVWSTRPGMSR